ncbi:ribonuclease T [Cognatishimia sp.]|uniref:ribonuclease T2 family protein n=1 Tax=Cognatishimia sp. TaxID=2211648 RepID=UPI0035124645
MLRTLALIAVILSTPLRAEGERSGAFDYYVLALSWSPNWCRLEGDARQSDQCKPGTGFGWILHGLWPQYHQGWPSYCPTAKAPPSRRMTADMADIMGTSGLAWHQWKKHGTCAGLSTEAYFDLSREAYARVTRPEVLRKLKDPVTLPASLIEEAFLAENPELEPDGITITCKQGLIQEARICLSKSLEPVPCGRDVVKDCRQTDAGFAPIR